MVRSIQSKHRYFRYKSTITGRFKFKIAESATKGRVAGVVVAKSDKLTLLKMLWQLIQGNIEKAPDVYSLMSSRL